MRHIEAHQQDVTVQDTGYESAAAAVRRIEQLEHTIATMKQQQQHQQQQQEETSAVAVATNINYNKYTAAEGAGDGRQQDRSKKKPRANSSPAPVNYSIGYDTILPTMEASACWTMKMDPNTLQR